MESILPALVGIFILQAASMAAPSDDALVSHKHTEEGFKLDSLIPGKGDQSSIENESSQRQKRFYNYNPFAYSSPGYPTNFPPPQPFHSQFSKRDEGQNTGTYGSGDVLSLIYERLEQILSNTRQHAYPVTQQIPIPTFIPLLVVPQFGCGCSTKNENPLTTKPFNNNNKPQTNTPTESTTPIESTTPGLFNRFNGINDTESNGQLEDNGNRPISFDPVIPESPIDIPVPPVEHGSVQSGAQPELISTTTFRAILNSPAITQSGVKRPSIVSRIPSIAPSDCDAAVIKCCVALKPTPNCFSQYGCPDPSRYGKPCDLDVIKNVLNKVRHYYQQLQL